MTLPGHAADPAAAMQTSDSPVYSSHVETLASDAGTSEEAKRTSASKAIRQREASEVLCLLSRDALLKLCVELATSNPEIHNKVMRNAKMDPSARKLFVRGLSYTTTNETLRSAFESFGDIEEAVVIMDKARNQSKGYAFVTFSTAEAALAAIRIPEKLIDGRTAIANLAAAGKAELPLLPLPGARKRGRFEGDMHIGMPAMYGPGPSYHAYSQHYAGSDPYARPSLRPQEMSKPHYYGYPS